MKIFGYIVVAVIAVSFLGLFIIGTIAPETYVYLGRQVPKKYVKEIKELGLLEEDETLVYFYTDGFTGIKEGMYFVTNKNLVAYNQEWQEPKTIVPFGEIIDLSVEYDDAFLMDSYIYIESEDGLELNFPVSSEKGRDKLFYQHMQKSIRKAKDSATKFQNN